MRRWQLGAALVCALSIALPDTAQAGGRRPGDGDGQKVTVRVTENRRAARATTGRPGSEVTYRRVSGCSTWTDPVTGKKMRQCPSLFGGTPFEVADATPDGVEVGDIRPPTPQVETHGAWYAQRVGYVWVDPGLYGGGDVPAGLVAPGGGGVGWATVRLSRVVFDPGFGGEARDCSREEILTPYDPGRAHVDQDSCAWIYDVSSRPNRAATADGKYHARLRLFWTVTSVRFASGNVASAGELAALGELDSDSEPLLIEVREIQSLVVCKSPDATGCD